MSTHMSTHTHVYTHAYTRVYTHVYTHVYPHVYPHVFAQVGAIDLLARDNPNRRGGMRMNQDGSMKVCAHISTRTLIHSIGNPH